MGNDQDVDVFDPGCKQGKIIKVTLADVPQFTAPNPHYIKFKLWDKLVGRKFSKLHDRIHEVMTSIKPRPLLPEDQLRRGIRCIVHPDKSYRRGIINSRMRYDIVKVLLEDTGSTVMVHLSRVYTVPTKELGEMKLIEPRIITCELEGLSDFASTFHLQHILKNQIDWNNDLEVHVTRTGAVPVVNCYSSTYLTKSVNKVILDYLYSAYNPSRLIKKHLYWPNTVISDFTNGRIFIQLDTPLRDHVNKILRDPNPLSLYQLPTVVQYEDNVIYLGKFGARDYFERCMITKLPVRVPGFAHDQPPRFAQDQPLRCAEEQPPRFAPVQPPRTAQDQPHCFAPDQPPLFAQDPPPRFAQDPPPRFAQDQPPRLAPVQPPCFAQDQPPCFAPDQPPRFAQDQPPRLAEDQPARFAPVQPPCFAPDQPPRFAVYYIDTAVRTEFGPGSELYPFFIKGISEDQTTAASLSSIPPLCTEVNLAGMPGVDHIPDNYLSRIVLDKVEVIVEAQDYTGQGLPTVEIYPALPAFFRRPVPTLDMNDDFKSRKFSSLHNWTMPLLGQNWGKDESERVFDLVPGTKISGIVTRIDAPGSFYIRPIDPAPCPVLRRSFAALEFSCGCLWDGHFFRVKMDESDLRNTRVRLLEPVTRSQPLLHFHEAVRNVTVRARFVDTGAVDNVSVLQLRKLGQLTASVPPRVALVSLLDGLWYEDSYTELDWRILGRRILGNTLRMEIMNVDMDELNGLLRLKVKILSNENGPILIERKSTVTEIEK